MNNKPGITMKNRSILGNTAGWFFGTLVLVIGVINSFWGNDPGYGIFISLLAFFYFPPANRFLRKIASISISPIVKIVLGLLIVWTALGVAELFDKIDLMLQDFSFYYN